MKSSTGLLIIAFIVACSAVTTTTKCPLSSSQQSQIVSDSVGLTAQNNSNGVNAQNLIYSYPFSDSFSTVPQVAIGLNQISASESPYLQILIENARTTQNGIYFQAKSDAQSQWRNFKINFIASSRNDIQLGSATVYNPALTPDNTFDLRYSVQQNFSSQAIKIKSFLQGVSLESANNQTIGVTQRNSYVSSHTLYFTFASAQRTSIIRQLTISVIIYSINTPGVLYADGIIDQNFVVSKTEITIPKHGINQLRTYIVGINSFQTSAAKPISISTAIDETFRLIIGPIDRTEIAYISVSYLILSVVDCGSCSGYPLLFDGLCSVSCPNGTKQKNGVCVPIDCVDGYELVGGQCILQCKTNEYYDNVTGRCFCQDSYYLINTLCQKCPIAHYFDFKQRKCVPYCTYNSYYNAADGKCYCNDGFNLINGICQKCPYGTAYSAADQKCYDICRINEIFSPQGCICRNQYYKIEGVCSRCPYGQIWNPQLNKCGCPRGQQLIQGNACKPLCDINEQRVGLYCDCLVGYQRINGKCGLCPLRSTYHAGLAKCVCDNPYTLVNGQCVIICPPHQFLDKKTEKCVNYCEKYGEVFVNAKCVCDNDFQRTSNGSCIKKCGAIQTRDSQGICRCFDGYWKNPYGQCRQINCPPGTLWNKVYEDCISICNVLQVYINGACLCKAGFQKDNVYGKCLPDCGVTQVRVNGFCQCAPGYKQVGGGYCILDCAPGSTNINNMCVCKANCGNGIPYCPYGQTYEPLTQQCRCPSPKVWILGQCQINNQCSANEYWCGSYCACNNGFFRVNGVCTRVPIARQCPFNSVSNGVNCQCQPGFYPVTPGFCQRCPVGQMWIGTKCAVDFCEKGYIYNQATNTCLPPRPLCNQNQQWDGVGCRCKQGYFWINFKCQSCPYGTFFDGLKCTPGAGTRCTDPYALWNGLRCVCVPGYYPLPNGKCVTCPANSYWDGSCCKPQYGYYENWTVI